MADIFSLADKRRPRKRSHDIIDAAVERDQPLPLEVLLANLHYWYSECLRLEGSKHPGDIALARIARAQAQKCAVDAAQFCHAKLAQQTISGDAEQPLTIEHKYPPIPPAALKGRSLADLGQIYLALSQGNQERLAELCPEAAE